MKKLFVLILIVGLLGGLTGAISACNKSASPAPNPVDTTSKPGQDTVHIGGDTSKGNKGDTTKPKASVTKIYEANGWSIALDQKTQAIHEMQSTGFVATEIMDPTDTGAIRAEFINLDKGTYTLGHDQYGGDTIWYYKFSNLNDFYSGSQAIDTVGKLAVHVYRSDGKDVKSGIKDIYFYISYYPTSGSNLIGNGQISFGPFRGDTTIISTTWLANKIAEKKYYFRLLDITTM